MLVARGLLFLLMTTLGLLAVGFEILTIRANTVTSVVS